MPYSYPGNIPAWSKNLPKGAQKIAVSVFNAALKNGSSEDEARIAAWGAIKQKYKKVGDKWVAKSFSVKLDSYITDDNMPDDVSELPGSMPYVWKTVYNKLIAKDMSVPIARNHSWKIVKKYVYRSSNGDWHMKKLELPERILGTVKVANRSIGMKYFAAQKDNGLFRLNIPFEGKSLEVDSDGKKFLKGVASGSWVDREDDLIMPSFIKKMKTMAKNLPVFVDHIRDSDHIIGHVVSVDDSDDEVFIPKTELEKEWSGDNPTGNQQVTKLLSRLGDIKFGYSIGGRFTKAVKRWNTKLNKYIREIYDGELYELSVVPVPALEGTDVQLVVKHFDEFFVDPTDELTKEYSEFDIKSDTTIPDVSVVQSDSNEDLKNDFWMDFNKAVDTYVKLSAGQPALSDIEVDKLPDSCFAFVSIDKSVRKYPFKHVIKDGSTEIHLEALDKSYKNAVDDDNKSAVKILSDVRDSLGIGEKEYNYVDFKKLLVGTLTDAIDARDARYRLYDVIDQYYSTVDKIVWSDSTIADKSADLTALTNQLIAELSQLTTKMSKEVIVSVKNLSVEAE